MTCAASCRSTSANRVRLALHAADDWLMLTLRNAMLAADCLQCKQSCS
jgi:hypothetical protein